MRTTMYKKDYKQLVKKPSSEN